MKSTEPKEAGGDTPQLVLRGVSSATTPPKVEAAKAPPMPVAAAVVSTLPSFSVICVFAAIAAVAIGLGVGLSASTKSDTGSSSPPQSLVNIAFDVGNIVLTDSNVTDLRCSLANATGVPVSRVLFVSWTDAANTNYSVSASDPFNLGTCLQGSPPARRRLSSSSSSGSVASARLLPATASAATIARYTILINDDTIPIATRQVWARAYNLPIREVVSNSLLFTPTPSGTPTPTSTPTPTPSNTPTPTNTPTPSNSPTPSVTPTMTPTGTSTQTPTGTPSPTQTPTSTSTPTPSITPSATSTISESPTPSITPSSSPTITTSNTPTPTPTPSPSYKPPPFTNFPLPGGLIGVEGSVVDILEWNGLIYVGGLFSTLGDGFTSAKNIAAWDGTTWSNLPSGGSNGVGNTVFSLAVFSGKLYAGGRFITLGDGTTSANYIAAWDGTSWSNLTIGGSNGVGGPVSALAVFSGKLYVGGWFNTLGDGTSAKNIAAWDGTSWSNLTVGGSNGVKDAVNELAVFSGKLYVGGLFTALGDGTTSAKNIAAWDGTSWSNLPVGSGNGLGGTVIALAVFSGKLYVGGRFTSLGDGNTFATSTPATRIAAWDGTTWSTLPIGSSNGVGDFVVTLSASDSKLYVGGLFQTLGDFTTSAKYVAAWDGTAWSNVTCGSSNGVGGSVNVVAVFNSTLYVGGLFSALGDGTTHAKNIATWNVSSSATVDGVLRVPSLPVAGLTSDVKSLAIFDDKLYVGGKFTFTSDFGTSVTRIASWNGSAWSNLPSGSRNGLGPTTDISGKTPDPVNALCVFGSKLYAGGTFTTLGDGITSAKNIAAWDGTSWSNLPVGSSNGVYGTVYALAVFNSKLYVGGDFSNFGDAAFATVIPSLARGIAAWNGTSWSNLPVSDGNGVAGDVYALAVFDSKLYVGGEFGYIHTSVTKRIAAWDGSTWLTLASGTSNGIGVPNWSSVISVRALAVFNSKLYVGGEFTALGDGTSAKNIAAWNGTSWSNLTIGGSNGVGGTVHSLAVFSGKLYVGGAFTALGDGVTSANGIAAWDGGAWSNLTVGSSNGLGGTVFAMASNGSFLTIGGALSSFGDGSGPAGNIVRYRP
jgi:trimeric autotransporter adhesin